MQMRTLITLSVLFLCSGCTRSCSRTGDFDIRTNVAAAADEEYDFQIFEREMGYGYRLFLDETGRRYTTHLWIEIEQKNRTSGVTRSVHVDLMNQSGTDPSLTPGSLGAAKKYAFWGNRTEYFVVDLKTAGVSRVLNDSRFMGPGKWETVDGQTIRRTTEEGIFEVSATGTRQIAKFEPKKASSVD